MFYTYCHIRKDTGRIFYIGKGSNNRYKDIHHRNQWWKNIYNKTEVEFLILSYWEDEKDAFSHEKLLIECIPDLVNLSDGGEGSSGYKFTPEQRLKRSESLRQYYRENPDVAKKRASSRLGSTISEQHKVTLSVARTGTTLSTETRKKISTSTKGKKKKEGFGEIISSNMRDLWEQQDFITKQKLGIVKARGRAVIETTTNTRFETVTEAVIWLRQNGCPKMSTSWLGDRIRNKKQIINSFYFIYEVAICQD